MVLITTRWQLCAGLSILALYAGMVQADERVAERAVPLSTGMPLVTGTLANLLTDLDRQLKLIEAEASAVRASAAQRGTNIPAIVTSRYPRLLTLVRETAQKARSVRDTARLQKQLELEQKAAQIASDLDAIDRQIDEARAKAQAAQEAATLQFLTSIASAAAQMSGGLAGAAAGAAGSAFGQLPAGAVAQAPGSQLPRGTPVLEAPGQRPGATTNTEVEQRLAALQQQVQTLQAQVAALQSVLKVTPAGATLQAPTVSILTSGDTVIQSGKGITVRAATSIGVQSQVDVSLKAGATATIESTATTHLKGGILKLNDGSKPLATVGSQVQVPGQPIGQIVTGSPTLLGN